jgi:hypothetical protein
VSRIRREPASCDKRWPRERFACFSGSGSPSTTSRTRKRVPRYAQARDMQTNEVGLPIIKISFKAEIFDLSGNVIFTLTGTARIEV